MAAFRPTLTLLASTGNVLCPATAVVKPLLRKAVPFKGLAPLSPRAPSLDSIRSQLTFPITDPLPRAPTPSGWEPPLGNTQHLPFEVRRTESQLLPVYSDYRNGRSRNLTIVRKIFGDAQALKNDLSLVCGGARVIERPGRLEIVGDYRKPIRLWLKRLGF
eukprot:c3041_g1_i1.p1 GENE.c3041_g1_i1~~c3041_g1_i1.p1  ORF type:complete len:161 (+),score=33.62 c3041_g1_i1:30-512(+)